MQCMDEVDATGRRRTVDDFVAQAAAARLG
jgi:hypothetical protein